MLTFDENICLCLLHLAKNDLPGLVCNVLGTPENGYPETVLEEIKLILAIAVRERLTN